MNIYSVVAPARRKGRLITMNLKNGLRTAAAALLGTLLLGSLASCGKSDTVMTLGSFEVSYDHYRYIYMNVYSELSDDEELSDEERAQELSDAVSSSLRYSASVYELAKKNGVSLTDDEQKAIDETVAAAEEENGGKDEFEAQLREAYLTRDFFRRGLELQQLEQDLREKLTSENGGELAADDATITADAHENFYYIEYLLTSDAQDAEAALAEAKAGTPLSELAHDGRTLGSYCFTRGQLVEELEDAVLAVGDGELVDKVIAASDGCRVVRRVALTDELIDENFSEIRRAYLARRFGELRGETEAGLEEKHTELYDELTPEKLALPWSEAKNS